MVFNMKSSVRTRLKKVASSFMMITLCIIKRQTLNSYLDKALILHAPQTLSLEKPVMQKKEKHSHFLYFSGVYQVKGRKYHTCSTNKLYEESVT